MRRDGSSPLQAVRNLVQRDVPFPRRVALMLRNWLARLGPPPRGCCDHPGEPGC